MNLNDLRKQILTGCQKYPKNCLICKYLKFNNFVCVFNVEAEFLRCVLRILLSNKFVFF